MTALAHELQQRITTLSAAGEIGPLTIELLDRVVLALDSDENTKRGQCLDAVYDKVCNLICDLEVHEHAEDRDERRVYAGMPLSALRKISKRIEETR